MQENPKFLSCTVDMLFESVNYRNGNETVWKSQSAQSKLAFRGNMTKRWLHMVCGNICDIFSPFVLSIICAVIWNKFVYKLKQQQQQQQNKNEMSSSLLKWMISSGDDDDGDSGGGGGRFADGDGQTDD